MRIAQVIFDFGLGGVQKGGVVLADAMARRGHEVFVLGRRGPRFREGTTPGLTHVAVESDEPVDFAQAAAELKLDVVHAHRANYSSAFIRTMAERSPATLCVSTPVFGRPPNDRALLGHTRVCLVGCYTFYRYCKWLGISPEEATRRGTGYVPITPFETPAETVSTLDGSETIVSRRAAFGLGEAKRVVGRIGRNHVAKWTPDHERLIDTLLESDEQLHWLSVGLPEQFGATGLAARWGRRFVNLPETPDYALLTRVLASFDLQILFGHGECFASSIAEAAGVGVPTIALATPLRDNGQAEQVDDGRTGWLVGSIEQAVDRVREAFTSSGKLVEMKAAAREMATTRWSAARAGDDLLSLYDYWRRPAAAPPAYIATMLEETRTFAEQYHSRIARLMGHGPIGQSIWRLQMKAVENGSIFRMGRAVRRLRHRKQYKALPKDE